MKKILMMTVMMMSPLYAKKGCPEENCNAAAKALGYDHCDRSDNRCLCYNKHGNEYLRIVPTPKCLTPKTWDDLSSDGTIEKAKNGDGEALDQVYDPD
jgi:hypothetical protein